MKQLIAIKYITVSLLILMVSCANNTPSTTKITNTSPVVAASGDIATQNNESTTHNPLDPFENYNRNAFRMNMKLDGAVVRPTAVWYITNVPSPIRYSIANFYNNLRDFVTLGDDILQLNGTNTMKTLMRTSINTTVGLLGFIDIATGIGLKDHRNNFGNTLKFYGWKNSSYFVMPLLGPYTVRDAIGLIPDVYFNPTWYVVDNNYISVGLFTIGALDSRSKYLDADALLATSLNPYITMRDVYMQSIGEPIIYKGHNDSSINIDNLIDGNSSNESTAVINPPLESALK